MVIYRVRRCLPSSLWHTDVPMLHRFMVLIPIESKRRSSSVLVSSKLGCRYASFKHINHVACVIGPGLVWRLVDKCEEASRSRRGDSDELLMVVFGFLCRWWSTNHIKPNVRLPSSRRSSTYGLPIRVTLRKLGGRTYNSVGSKGGRHVIGGYCIPS